MEKSLKVLIADDASAMRRVIIKALKTMSLKNFIEVENGKSALDTLATQKVDLIISDWNMPILNGLELLKTIQKSKKYNNIPFIMITSEGGENAFQEAMRHGAADYIAKPFTAETLISKVKSVMLWAAS